MPEEFGVDGTLGYGAAVDGDIGVELARAIGVDDLREGLLAGAALTDDEDGEMDWGDLDGGLDGLLKLQVIADDSEARLNVRDIHDKERLNKPEAP